jgi:hypothetical protein
MRSVRKGSITSTLIGPTSFASARSSGARLEACTLICSASGVPPPTTTLNDASTTWRFG